MDETQSSTEGMTAAPPPEAAEAPQNAPETAPEAAPTTAEGALPEPTGDKPVANTPKKTDKKKKAAAKKPATKAAAVKNPTTKKAPPRKDVPKNLMMPLSRIELSEDWNRHALGDNSGMVSSLNDVGQISPVSIWPIPGSTKFLLIVGRRRYAAALELGWKTLKVTICKGNLAELKLLALAENLQREGNTHYELALGFRQLVDEHRRTAAQIAKSCGKTPGFVSQHLAVTKAPKKLQQGLVKGRVGVSIFRYFAKLDPVEDKAFYDKLVDAALGGLPGSKVDEKVDAYLEKKAKKAAQEGKAPPKAAKKGAAAHKKKKGAQLFIRDYSSPEVRKEVAMVNKTTALARLEETAAKLAKATRKDKQTYLQGVLDGMEECAGLVEVSKG